MDVICRSGNIRIGNFTILDFFLLGFPDKVVVRIQYSFKVYRGLKRRDLQLETPQIPWGSLGYSQTRVTAILESYLNLAITCGRGETLG